MREYPECITSVEGIRPSVANGHDHMASIKEMSQTLAAHLVNLSSSTDFSMDLMLVETVHFWNTPSKSSFLRECVVIK
jgi:hypothetical protein